MGLTEKSYLCLWELEALQLQRWGGVCFHNGEAKLLEGISVGVHASVYEERYEILDLTFVLLCTRASGR
jgi:hypothetical protein